MEKGKYIGDISCFKVLNVEHAKRVWADRR